MNTVEHASAYCLTCHQELGSFEGRYAFDEALKICTKHQIQTFKLYNQQHRVEVREGRA